MSKKIKSRFIYISCAILSGLLLLFGVYAFNFNISEKKISNNNSIETTDAASTNVSFAGVELSLDYHSTVYCPRNSSMGSHGPNSSASTSAFSDSHLGIVEITHNGVTKLSTYTLFASGYSTKDVRCNRFANIQGTPCGYAFFNCRYFMAAGNYQLSNTLFAEQSTGGYGSYSLSFCDATGQKIDGRRLVTLTAPSVSLTINPNGGVFTNPTTTTYTGTYGNQVSLVLETPTRPNYIFTGWTLIGGGKVNNSFTQYTFGDTNAALTANWQIKNYTLSIDANGGSYGGTTTIAQSTGTTTTLQVPTREGYIFKGWSNIGDGVNLLAGDNTFESLEIGAFAGFTNQTGGDKVGVSSDAKNGTKGFSFTGGSGKNRIYKNLWVSMAKKYTFSLWYKSSVKSNIAGRVELYGGAYNWEGYATAYTDTDNWQYLTLNFENLKSDTGLYCFAYDYGQGASIDDFGLYSYNGALTGNKYTFAAGNDTLVAVWERDTWEKFGIQPAVSADGFYEISKPEHLAWFSGSIVDKSLRLIADIDLSAHFWIPIKQASSRIIDGQGYKIEGLNNFAKDESYQALFSKADGSTIKNLDVYGIIGSPNQGGGYVGNSGNITFINCNNYVNVSGGWNLGGFAGLLSGARFINCSNFGDINSTAGQVGGFVGDYYGSVKFQNCRNFGEINCSNNSSGGFIGYYHLNENSNFEMLNCYSNAVCSAGSPLIGQFDNNAVSYASFIMDSCGVELKNFNLGRESSSYGALFGTINLAASAYMENFAIKNCYIKGTANSLATLTSPMKILVGNRDADNYLLNKMESVYIDVGVDVGVSQTTYRKYTSGDFSKFSVVSGINNNMPVPSGLFWIGGVGGQNILTFFKNNKDFSVLL